MYKTYILGNGGFAQEVFEQIILTKQSDNFGGFIIIKQETAHSISEDGVRVFEYPENCSFILGTSNAAWREMFIEHFTNHYPLNINHFPNVSAINCHISQTSRIGVGNVFLSFSLLNANAEVGNFNTFNCYSSIHHDCVVGDNNFFHQYASARSCTVIGNSNILEAGEVLFEDMNNNEILSMGVVHGDGKVQ